MMGRQKPEKVGLKVYGRKQRVDTRISWTKVSSNVFSTDESPSTSEASSAEHDERLSANESSELTRTRGPFAPLSDSSNNSDGIFGAIPRRGTNYARANTRRGRRGGNRKENRPAMQLRKRDKSADTKYVNESSTNLQGGITSKHLPLRPVKDKPIMTALTQMQLGELNFDEFDDYSLVVTNTPERRNKKPSESTVNTTGELFSVGCSENEGQPAAVSWLDGSREQRCHFAEQTRSRVAAETDVSDSSLPQRFVRKSKRLLCMSMGSSASASRGERIHTQASGLMGTSTPLQHAVLMIRGQQLPGVGLSPVPLAEETHAEDEESVCFPESPSLVHDVASREVVDCEPCGQCSQSGREQCDCRYKRVTYRPAPVARSSYGNSHRNFSFEQLRSSIHSIQSGTDHLLGSGRVTERRRRPHAGVVPALLVSSSIAAESLGDSRRQSRRHARYLTRSAVILQASTELFDVSVASPTVAEDDGKLVRGATAGTDALDRLDADVAIDTDDSRASRAETEEALTCQSRCSADELETEGASELAEDDGREADDGADDANSTRYMLNTDVETAVAMMSACSLFESPHPSQRSGVRGADDVRPSDAADERLEDEVDDAGSDVGMLSRDRSVNQSGFERQAPCQLSARERVLDECEQEDYISFYKCLSSRMMKTSRKIGEGVYGEVFRVQDADKHDVAVKIIPIEGSDIVNDEAQKTFSEILPEIVISRELSSLQWANNNCTPNFTTVRRVSCVQGAYPSKLLQEWDSYNKRKGSENDRPDFFSKDQLFIVFEFEDGGEALERFQFSSMLEANSVVQQLVCSLATAEAQYEFEHRDLHWGNVLVKRTEKRHLRYVIGSSEVVLPSHGVQICIIDFTLSRIKKNGCVIYVDLALDPTIFTGEGDYQFSIYRRMKEKNENNWEMHCPFTNVLWLHYIMDKLLFETNYHQHDPETRVALRTFRDAYKELLNHISADDVYKNSILFNT
ncbi:PREDICTED: uncharacterized protein LOC106807388 [Priapulus caudatus]|uniref:non-specific serine/threonine protein kinase n=1 Tax=Priapulus caudatus TaxID=37621 RepID=A0ABM1DZ19_PRICU|nr:PREDICTED: uncharacterized protein LOC106807388 [Priapulus caudatus]